MNRETDEYLRGLYETDEDPDNGPYINWTRGFEANSQEYDEYGNQESPSANSNEYQHQWTTWEKG